jgi:hypothetical protein
MFNHRSVAMILLVASSCLMAAAPATAPTTAIDFERYDAGKTPADFKAELTAGGGPVNWVIQQDPTAPAGAKVLAQLSTDTTSRRYPVCTFNDFSARDVEVSTQFKAISGTVDQAAGLVARFKDKDNYYVVRANAMEDNVRLYKIQNGTRTQFAGVDVKVEPAKWHTLSFVVQGSHFKIGMNGKTLFEADDPTFKDAGRVGLWTKADSVTYFDDMKIRTIDGSEK